MENWKLVLINHENPVSFQNDGELFIKLVNFAKEWANFFREVTSYNTIKVIDENKNVIISITHMTTYTFTLKIGLFVENNSLFLKGDYTSDWFIDRRFENYTYDKKEILLPLDWNIDLNKNDIMDIFSKSFIEFDNCKKNKQNI